MTRGVSIEPKQPTIDFSRPTGASVCHTKLKGSSRLKIFLSLGSRSDFLFSDQGVRRGDRQAEDRDGEAERPEGGRGWTAEGGRREAGGRELEAQRQPRRHEEGLPEEGEGGRAEDFRGRCQPRAFRRVNTAERERERERGEGEGERERLACMGNF